VRDAVRTVVGRFLAAFAVWQRMGKCDDDDDDDARWWKEEEQPPQQWRRTPGIVVSR